MDGQTSLGVLKVRRNGRNFLIRDIKVILNSATFLRILRIFNLKMQVSIEFIERESWSYILKGVILLKRHAWSHDVHIIAIWYIWYRFQNLSPIYSENGGSLDNIWQTNCSLYWTCQIQSLDCKYNKNKKCSVSVLVKVKIHMNLILEYS